MQTRKIKGLAKVLGISLIVGASAISYGQESPMGWAFRTIGPTRPQAWPAVQFAADMEDQEYQKYLIEHNTKKALDAKEAELKAEAEKIRRQNVILEGEELKKIREEKQRLERDPYNLENKIVFTCNRWVDLNKDNVTDWNEYQGVKNSFEYGEDIVFAIKGDSSGEKKFKAVIALPNGNTFSTPEMTLPIRGIWGTEPILKDRFFSPLFNKYGSGSYKVAVYFDDKLAAVHDFEIKGNKNRNLQSGLETKPAPVQERKQEYLPEGSFVFSEMFSPDDTLEEIVFEKNGDLSKIVAKNKTFGEYTLKKRLFMSGKINQEDKMVKTSPHGEIYKNEAYGYYIICPQLAKGPSQDKNTAKKTLFGYPVE